jgi:hypothetical protein
MGCYFAGDLPEMEATAHASRQPIQEQRLEQPRTGLRLPSGKLSFTRHCVDILPAKHNRF